MLTEVEVLALFARPNCPDYIVSWGMGDCCYVWNYDVCEYVLDERQLVLDMVWCREFWNHFENLVADGELVGAFGQYWQPAGVAET